MALFNGRHLISSSSSFSSNSAVLEFLVLLSVSVPLLPLLLLSALIRLHSRNISIYLLSCHDIIIDICTYTYNLHELAWNMDACTSISVRYENIFQANDRQWDKHRRRSSQASGNVHRDSHPSRFAAAPELLDGSPCSHNTQYTWGPPWMAVPTACRSQSPHSSRTRSTDHQPRTSSIECVCECMRSGSHRFVPRPVSI